MYQTQLSVYLSETMCGLLERWFAYLVFYDYLGEWW